jgi:DNA-binding transcriptional LysR family regulator
MELEVRHLRVLVAVADHGSATKAAAALGLSQPSLCPPSCAGSNG